MAFISRLWRLFMHHQVVSIFIWTQQRQVSGTNSSIFPNIMLLFLHVFLSENLISIYTGSRNNTSVSRYLFCSWWLRFHFWCSGNRFIQYMLHSCFIRCFKLPARMLFLSIGTIFCKSIHSQLIELLEHGSTADVAGKHCRITSLSPWSWVLAGFKFVRATGSSDGDGVTVLGVSTHMYCCCKFLKIINHEKELSDIPELAVSVKYWLYGLWICHSYKNRYVAGIY